MQESMSISGNNYSAVIFSLFVLLAYLFTFLMFVYAVLPVIVIILHGILIEVFQLFFISVLTIVFHVIYYL